MNNSKAMPNNKTPTPKTYIALTIGPIFKTIGNARSTKELWGASYLFSDLMRRLVEQIQKELHKRNFIMPYVEDINANKGEHFGAGIFPDRLIFEAEESDAAIFDGIIKKVLGGLADEIEAHIAKMFCEKKLKSVDFGKVHDFVFDYFQIHWLAKRLPEKLPDGESVITILSPYLDTLELQQTWMNREQTMRLEGHKKTFQTCLEFYLSTIHNSELSEEVFTKKGHGVYAYMEEKGFPSIQDISTIGLYQNALLRVDFLAARNEAERRKKKDEDEAKVNGEKKPKTTEYLFDELIEIFNKGKEPDKRQFKQYHKYVCIVHADGDNVGDTVKRLDKEEKFVRFSKELSGFAKDAAKIINDYGGKPVYIGGDDLLFFAPVKSQNGSIFQLIEQLDERFEKCDFGVAEAMKPTLSFGVSISYHKFPLFESLEISRNLMEEKAKGFTDKSGKKIKNAVAFRVLKHSGQFFEGVLHKNKPETDSDGGSYALFLNLLLKTSQTNNQLNSLTYKLRDQKTLVREMVGKLGWQKRMEYFFGNFFNEGVHQNNAYLNDVKHLLIKLLEETVPDTADAQLKELKATQAIDTFYAQLRIINFLNAKASADER